MVGDFYKDTIKYKPILFNLAGLELSIVPFVIVIVDCVALIFPFV